MYLDYFMKHGSPTIVTNMGQVINHLETGYVFSPKEVFIIGGGSIYEQLLPYCDCVYVTKILKEHKDVDTYFPNLDKNPEWEIDTCTELREYNGIPYAFLTYKRV